MSKMTDTTPSPGSHEAIDLGCQCPTPSGGWRAVFDWDYTDYVIFKVCPLHGKHKHAIAKKRIKC